MVEHLPSTQAEMGSIPRGGREGEKEGILFPTLESLFLSLNLVEENYNKEQDKNPKTSSGKFYMSKA